MAVHALLHSLQSRKKEEEKKLSASTSHVKLSPEAAKLPLHIRLSADPVKLNAQIPFFVCPDWAGLPPTSYHLYCTREGSPYPSLNVSRFPYFIFGKHKVADFVLEHPSISAIHAALVYHKERDAFILCDLNSTNGVRVNGTRLLREVLVPLAVGSVIQFGYSSRQYELRKGKAPPSKRNREWEDEMRADLEAVEADAPTSQEGGASSSTSAVKSPHLDNVLSNTNTSGDSVGTKEADRGNTAPDAAKQYHLFQLILKHKDLKNPTSFAAHNRGLRVTRSIEDAREMAHSIVSAHERLRKADATRTAGDFIPWTVNEFTDAISAYNEGKSKTNGDLGIVETGKYGEAFDAVAFKLRRHEVSPPFESPLGIHLIYRCD